MKQKQTGVYQLMYGGGKVIFDIEQTEPWLRYKEHFVDSEGKLLDSAIVRQRLDSIPLCDRIFIGHILITLFGFHAESPKKDFHYNDSGAIIGTTR